MQQKNLLLPLCSSGILPAWAGLHDRGPLFDELEDHDVQLVRGVQHHTVTGHRD